MFTAAVIVLASAMFASIPLGCFAPGDRTRLAAGPIRPRRAAPPMDRLAVGPDGPTYNLRHFGRTGWTEQVANIAEKLQTRDPIPVDPKTGKTPSVL